MNVEHEPAGRRFVANGAEGVGFLRYREAAPGVLDFEYVEVEPRFRGKGVAGQIVEAACRYARAGGLRVIPTCPYVAWWFRQHPDYHDLLLSRESG